MRQRGVALPAAILAKEFVLNLAARVVVNGYRYYLSAGTLGMKAIEMLDDNGSIGAQNAGVFKSLAAAATRNAGAAKIMLGKYVPGSATSYNIRAGSEYTFFQLDNWDDVLKSFGNDIKEMWKINKQFIDDQIDAGKDIFLSHDPNQATGYFLQEVNHLKERGLKTFKQIGEDLWQAVKE